MGRDRRFQSNCADQFMIRFPDGMRDALKASAASNSRSLNAEIVHRLKQNGPAEAATSPSHGPTSLSKGIEGMNTATDTTAGASTASAAAASAVYDALQELDSNMRRLRILTREVEEFTGNFRNRDCDYYLTEREGEAVILFACDAADCAKATEKQLHALHGLVQIFRQGVGL